GVPLSREQCWVRILQYRGMWTTLGHGFWIIEDRASGRLVGEAGVQDMRRDMEPGLDGALECGWGLVPDAQGKGLAEEAMRAALDWAGRAQPAASFACVIAPANCPPSAPMAQI